MTPDEGVKRYDGVSLKTFTTADGLGRGNIQKIFEDKDGNLWFVSGVTATPDASRAVVYVSRYDGISFQNFPLKPLGDAGVGEITIHQDVHGILWFIAPPIGLWRYELPLRPGFDTQATQPDAASLRDGTDFEQVLTRGEPVVEMISGKKLRASIMDSAGNLWLATRDGAIKYNGVQFHIYTTEDGFLIDDIRDVQEDREGNIWFATWGGGVVHYDGTTFQTITTKDGLIHNNVRSILEDRVGNLWFATDGGISKYTPPVEKVAPPIHLTRLTADRIYTDIGEELTLPSKVSHVTFEYQGISFKTANMLYTYKLEGKDKEWSRATRSKRVDYDGLSPGSYTFFVKAISRELEYSNPPASVYFTILSPFYKRFGFIAPVSLGVLSMLLILFYQRRTITKLTKRLFSAEEKVKQTQAQLIQSEKMATIGALAGGVAHEINNPLDAILGSVQRIMRFPEDPKRVTESAQSAQEGTRRCKDIVEKLLKYARQSSDEFISLEVNQVIEDTVVLLAHQLKLESISLEMQLSPGLTVQGNFTELSQVITNLLINARDAIAAARATGKDAGVITVGAAAEKDEPREMEERLISRGEILIEITDDGIGIEEEHLGKLFDPFFTTKPVGKGTGLGLSICQGIVEKHHGRIEVESEVGQGATFRVFLPMAESDFEKV